MDELREMGFEYAFETSLRVGVGRVQLLAWAEYGGPAFRAGLSKRECHTVSPKAFGTIENRMPTEVR